MHGHLTNHKTKDIPLDEEVEWRLQKLFFPQGTESLWALNMVLPPQLAPPPPPDGQPVDPKAARAYACLRVHCAPDGPATPAPWVRTGQISADGGRDSRPDGPAGERRASNTTRRRN